MIYAPTDIYGDPQLSKGARLLLVLLWRDVGERQQSGTWIATVRKGELRSTLKITRNTLNRYIIEARESIWLVSVGQKRVLGPHAFELWAA